MFDKGLNSFVRIEADLRQFAKGSAIADEELGELQCFAGELRVFPVDIVGSNIRKSCVKSLGLLLFNELDCKLKGES